MTQPVQDQGNPSRLPPAFLERDGTQRPADHYDAPQLTADHGPVQFHVMAKPVGAICNLDCTYCFYLHKERSPAGLGRGRMSEATLELFIRQYIEGVTGTEVTFTWQGGEPALRGLDFYRRAVALQKQYARPGQVIQNDLQTNGTLLDDEWCAFLKENRFLVGLSIDGPRAVHDQYRVTRRQQPTFDSVMQAVSRLRKFGVPFNTLTCVHRRNARQPIDIYRFLRDEVGSTYMQFTPVVEYRGFDQRSVSANRALLQPQESDPESRPGHVNSVVTEWSVDPEDWGYFLCRLFDRWVARDLGKIYVNQFETLVAQHLDLPSHLCVYSEHCGKGVAVEHDGSIYACDHFVYPEYKIGHLQESSLRQAVLSRDQVKFGYAKRESLPQVCHACPYLSDCWGECPKNRILSSASGEPGLNYLCRGLKQFYTHALPHVERIAAGLRNQPISQGRRM